MQTHCEEPGDNSSTLSATSSALEAPSSPLPLEIVGVGEDSEGSGSQKCLKVGKGLCKVVSPLSCTWEQSTKFRVQHEGWVKIRGTKDLSCPGLLCFLSLPSTMAGHTGNLEQGFGTRHQSHRHPSETPASLSDKLKWKIGPSSHPV